MASSMVVLSRHASAWAGCGSSQVDGVYAAAQLGNGALCVPKGGGVVGGGDHGAVCAAGGQETGAQAGGESMSTPSIVPRPAAASMELSPNGWGGRAYRCGKR